MERIYNYGLFNFNQSNFYRNFTRGNLRYNMGTTHIGRFVDSYMHYNRSMTEQMLNLSLEPRQVIFEKLEWNALNENRDYYYDFFFDN